MAAQISASGRPHADDFAELSAGALSRQVLGETDWRAASDGSGPRRSDLVVLVDGVAALPIEVTTAALKAGELGSRERASLLLERLAPRRTIGWDIVVHLGPAMGPLEIDELVALTEDLPLGGDASAEGQWSYVQKPIDPSTPPEHILPLPEDAAPPWWSPRFARQYAFQQHQAGPAEHLRPPQVRVWWPPHVDAFINPLQKKVDRFQGEKGTPFVVAMDVEAMGGASLAWYEEHLPGWFATDGWQRLSGVLLFTNVVHWSRIGWTWRLHLNPHAEFPVALTDDALAQATRETGFGLRFQEEPVTAPIEGEHGRMPT